MTGRPRKSEQIRVNWDYINRAMVYGEVARHEDGRPDELVFPSHRKLAARLGCARSTIDLRATRRGWQARRKEAMAEYGMDGLLEMARRDGRLWPISGEPEPGLFIMAADKASSAAASTHAKAKAKAKKTKGAAQMPPPVLESGVREVSSLPLQNDQIEHLLVHGEVVEQTADSGMFQIRYPSQIEIAGRYGISPAKVLTIAKNGNTEERKAQAQTRYRMMVDDAVVEARAGAASDYHEQIQEIITHYIERFKENLIGGNVPADSVTDFDRMVKLGELMAGGVTARTEITNMPTLDELSQDYHKLRDGELTLGGGDGPNVIHDMDDPTTGFVKVVH